MGALSPLDNSSLSFEIIQNPLDSTQNTEYSLFSEYLSPLSQDQSNEQALNSLSSEEPFKNKESTGTQDFKLFAPSEEPPPKKRPKLFAEKHSRAQNNNSDAKAAQASENPSNESTNVQKKSNAAVSKVQMTLSERLSKTNNNERIPASLKENVKSILKSIPTNLADTKASTRSKVPLPKGITLRVEQNAEFRLTTTKAKGNRKDTSQTTVSHLSNRNQALSNSITSNEGRDQPRLETTPQNTKPGNKEAQQKITSSLSQLQQESPLHPLHKKARTVKKGRTEQLSPINRENRQPTTNKEAPLPRFIPLDKITEGQINSTFSVTPNEVQSQLLDTSSQEADGNPNQLGKGTTNTNATKASVSKAQQTARSSRATNWLKTLAERTSFLDKSNPDWKVLEMKLENGKGSMTVRVMREDDQVSVAVNFSDPEVKALAENQYHEILQDLENQYQKEVKFTFSEHGSSFFESFSSPTRQKPHPRQALQLPVEKPADEAKGEKPSSLSDGKVWIG